MGGVREVVRFVQYAFFTIKNARLLNYNVKISHKGVGSRDLQADLDCFPIGLV